MTKGSNDAAVDRLVARIRAQAGRLPELEQRRLFAGLVLEPPVSPAGEIFVRRRSSEHDHAYWEGHDGRVVRSPTGSLRAAGYAAGRLRREMERQGLLPAACGNEIDAGGAVVPASPANRFADEAGFVASRKAPDGADFVLYDRDNGGDWIGADERWVVCRYVGEANSGLVGLSSKADAMGVLRDAANGVELGIDFGEADGLPHP